MLDIFSFLNYITFAAAVIGGFLAVLWIYNSTLKERREIMRRHARLDGRYVARALERTALWQRLCFSVAALGTAAAIFTFAWVYRRRHGVDISPAYFGLASALGLAGVAGIVAFAWRRKKGVRNGED